MARLTSVSSTLAQPLGEPSTQLRPPMVQQPKLISETSMADCPSLRYFINPPRLLSQRNYEVKTHDFNVLRVHFVNFVYFVVRGFVAGKRFKVGKFDPLWSVY